MTASNWFICQNIVFTDDRLSGSTLKVMGNIQAGEGEWAIIGGTGEFAYAQGVASYKQMTSTPGGEVTRELQIRALCITLLKPPVPAVPTSTMPNPAEVLAPASSAPVPPARAVVVSTPDAVPMMYRKYGPWGSEKGKYFNMKTCDRITKVSVIYTSFIHTVQFSYIDRGINKSAQLGGQALPGSVVKEMSLEDGEYLRTFSVSTELIDGHARITSLSFGTNLRSYGRFGVEGRHSNFSITASNTNETLDLCPRTQPAPRSGPPASPPLPRARVAREPAESGGRRARHHWRAPRGPGHRRRFVRRIRRGLVAGRAARDGAIQSKAISGRSWTDIGDVDETSAGHSVLIRGFAQTIRPVSKKMGFVVLRQRRSTVQCLLVASADAGVSAQMVRFAASLTKESIVDVEGIVTPLKEPRKDLTQLVEIRVSKIYCINRAISTLPLNFEDAARTKAEFEAAEQKGVPMVHVHQDTRLNYRPIDIRTPANLSTFSIEHHVENLSKFREFLFSKNFIGIHTPKLIGGSSEGGASVFKLDYNGQPACLAQSPQLYKWMAICGGFGRVFEVGSIFRAEKSNTHRHLCEFIGLDAEMEIKEHYFEVCDIIDSLFVAIFDHLNEHLPSANVEAKYEQGIQMLKVFSKDFYTRSRRWHAWKCIVELHLTSLAGAQHRPQAFSIIYLFYIWKKTIEYSSSVRL
ncbi:hypothetical protein ZWY2020_051362 [Hordeum vulgare]|nr:hypothetical protein ZWY2020_051362 [Hordeum vulgare]